MKTRHHLIVSCFLRSYLSPHITQVHPHHHGERSLLLLRGESPSIYFWLQPRHHHAHLCWGHQDYDVFAAEQVYEGSRCPSCHPVFLAPCSRTILSVDPNCASVGHRERDGHLQRVRILCPGLIRKNLSTTVPVVNTK
jgi:hypothetical protein